MALPLKPPFPPMEAQLVDALPQGTEWRYEPKWDGFRCLVFKDGDDVQLQSKSGQPLARYFPELVALLLEVAAKRFVLDGEIVIPVGRILSFDDLLQRIHPAASRIKKLAAETPATLVVFDLLVDEKGNDLRGLPLRERRGTLEAFASRYLAPHAARLPVSPFTDDVAVARRWLSGVGKGGSTDGVIAKRADLAYRSGERTGMRKVKRLRSADCVVGGFRYATGKKLVGSLLLGLYEDDGLLHHVGFTSGIKEAERRALTEKLEPLIGGSGFTGRAPGGPSRWSTERSTEWVGLAPELVVEVQYDHFTGGRFRHGTRLLRWRPEKLPRQCTMDQVKKGSAGALGLLGALS
jgi:ATP-dependent DNA ligase